MSLESLRLQAQQAILNGLSSGHLRTTLAEIKSTQESDECRKESLRLSLKDTISKAARDGRLETALKSQTAQSSDEAAVDDLRSKLRCTLLEAASDGRLEAELQKSTKDADSRSDDIEQMRIKVRSALCEAHSTGRMQATLNEMRQDRGVESNDSIEVLRMRARQTILDAAEDGRLQVEARRISEGSAKGTFENVEALPEMEHKRARQTEVAKPQILSGFSAIAAKLRTSFFGAAKDGSLSHAFQQIQKPVAQTPEELVFAKLRQTFAGAAASGQLSEAFSKIRPPDVDLPKDADETQDLRQHVRMVLSTAAQDGSLLDALADFRQSQQTSVSEGAAAAVRNTESTAIPAKPTAAKGATRPCRHYVRASTLGNAAISATPEVEYENGAVPTPTAASKRNRRIIGGFARPATAEDQEASEPMSPATGRRSLVTTFRMDVSEASATGNHLRVQPGSKLRCSSQSTSTPRVSNMQSAMALDLMEQTPAISTPFPIEAVQAVRKSRTSQSLGALRVSKGGSKLPPLLATNTFAPSTWTVDIGLNSHQWDVL